MFNDFRLKLFLEQRQKLFPDARTHPLRVAVSGIFAPGLFLGAQEAPQFAPSNAQQRANDHTGGSAATAVAPRAAAARRDVEGIVGFLGGTLSETRNRPPAGRHFSVGRCG